MSQSTPDAAHEAEPLGDPNTHAALRLWVALARAFESVADHARDDLRKQRMSPGEFGVLEMLYHRGPLLLGEIQRRILVSSGGVTFLVDRLAAKGLVERQDCPSDRRARYAALTPAGEKLIRRIFPLHAARIATALGGLSEASQRDLARSLKELGEGAQQRGGKSRGRKRR
jgi:MarR family 2-MHQ and catechol resistance regulon transcriptional repressor